MSIEESSTEPEGRAAAERTKIFDMFQHVYSNISKETSIMRHLSSALHLTFDEISEKDPDMDEYLGMTYFDHQHSGTEAGRKAVTTTVNRVAVKLRHPDGKIAELVRLLPTLLHELAHVSAELHRDIDPTVFERSKKMKQFQKDHSSHDETFYEHFRRILKTAEQLGIYMMPPSTQNRFNTHFLRRFDAINHLDCPPEFTGSTNLKIIYGSSEVVVPPLETLSISPATKSWVLTVSNSKGVSKTVQLDNLKMDELRKLIKMKFRAAPKKIFVLKGSIPLEKDEDLSTHLSAQGANVQLSFV